MKWYVRFKDALSLVIFMLLFAGILWWIIAAAASVRG